MDKIGKNNSTDSDMVEVQAVIREIDVIRDELVRQRQKGMDQYFERLLRNHLQEPGKVVKTLAKCGCCERHKVNKPTELKKWVETTFSGNETTCECMCRHYSRFVCRACSY